ncbi:MAG: hypothetical protein NXI09_07715 [Bacteroidetes bacterium]|nr:hypothetical protein [Bacteroidota bacterium]
MPVMWEYLKGLFLVVFLLSFSLKGQNLLGSFCEEFEGIAEHAMRYRFDGNGQFDYQYWDDVADEFGSGSYVIQNDSLILNFKALPSEWNSPQIKAQDNEKEYSSFLMLNPVPTLGKWQVSYRLMRGDSLIERGKADYYGRFEIRLEPDQRLELFAHSGNAFDDMLIPLQFEIKGKEKQKDYIIIATGIRTYCHILAKQRKAIPIRIKRKGFALKYAGDWISFKDCYN